MKKKEKLILSSTLVTLLLSGTFINVKAEEMKDQYAHNNRHGFEFTISGKNDRYSNYYYRSAGSTSVPWGVGLDESGEGQSTYTTFWMEEDGGGHTAAAHDVKVGHKKVTSPYVKANHNDNRLTAQDNDNGNGEYYVKGGWDEECKDNW